MSAQEDLTAALAREIRAAVAETARRPPASGAAELPDSSAARQALERAAAHATPVIPRGARLERAKMVLVRLLRFLWRDQSAFNALSLEASLGLASALERAERRALDLVRLVETAHGEGKRRAAVQDARLAALEIGRPATPAARTGAAPSFPPGVYALFEERFRGSPEEISERQQFYLPVLRGLPGPILDVGCGRGELLRLLREEGVTASGVEINPIAAALCRAEGLEVEEGDALETLSRRPAASLGGVVALQVVEHWSPEQIYAFLRESARALAPGGVLVAETINADSVSAMKAFYLDPSHVRPVPPATLRFLAEAAGFAETRIEFRSPLPAAERLEEHSTNDVKLNALLFAPQDYALVARTLSGGGA
jgi:SAM-dependent methyltransferase